MQFKIYRSTDTSAPVLQGIVNSLVALLKACLCDGYGSQAPAGWSSSFVSGNLGVFTPAVGSTLSNLAIDDNGPGAGGAKEARVRAYETVTSATAGTNPFPTVAQQTNGLIWRKSTSADVTARTWVLFATDSVFFLFVNTGDFAASMSFGFGDFTPLQCNDRYRSFIFGRAVENNGTANNEAWTTYSNTGSFYLDRDIGGSALSIGATRLCGTNGGATLGKGGYTTLMPATIRPISKIAIREQTNTVLRGHIPGMWSTQSDSAAGWNNGDTFSGKGALDGRTFEIILVGNTLGTFTAAVMETSNTIDNLWGK